MNVTLSLRENTDEETEKKLLAQMQAEDDAQPQGTILVPPTDDSDVKDIQFNDVAVTVFVAIGRLVSILTPKNLRLASPTSAARCAVTAALFMAATCGAQAYVVGTTKRRSVSSRG